MNSVSDSIPFCSVIKFFIDLCARAFAYRFHSEQWCCFWAFVIHTASHQPSRCTGQEGVPYPWDSLEMLPGGEQHGLHMQSMYGSSCNRHKYTAPCGQWGVTDICAVELQASAHKESRIPLLFYISPMSWSYHPSPFFFLGRRGKNKL